MNLVVNTEQKGLVVHLQLYYIISAHAFLKLNDMESRVSLTNADVNYYHILT